MAKNASPQAPSEYAWPKRNAHEPWLVRMDGPLLLMA